VANVGFPIYNAHGNMTATLARSSGNSFVVNNQRTYDAWGNILSGVATADPKNRYCGNLGHQQDDESGLIYMRARYYEPGSGRFTSEDSSRDGSNWFDYCGCQPVTRSDQNGRLWLSDLSLQSMLDRLRVDMLFSPGAKIIANASLMFMRTWLVVDFAAMPFQDRDSTRKWTWIGSFQVAANATTSSGIGSIEDQAKAESDAYSIMLIMVMWVTDDSSWVGQN
jgi:RHS repeat-associated protein